MHMQAFPHFLQWTYTLQVDDGHTVRLATSFLRERGSFALDQNRYTIAREGFVAGPFVLRDERGVVAAAQKALMRRSFDVTTSAGVMLLAADFVLTRAFSIQYQDRVVGHIKPAHAFTRRADFTIETDLSLPECVFLFWLAMLTWRRASGSDGS